MTAEGTESLTAEDVDLVDMIATGSLPNAVVLTEKGRERFRGQGPTELLDAENTPIASLELASDRSARLNLLAPVATLPGIGGSRYRPDPESLNAGSKGLSRGPVPAFFFDDLPTVADLERIGQPDAGQIAPSLWFVLVGRARPSTAPTPAALLRSIVAAADAHHPASAHPRIIALPWTTTRSLADLQPAVEGDVLTAISRRYGATTAVLVSSLRTPHECSELQLLRDSWSTAVRALYPEASAVEVIRSGASSSGAVVFFTGLSGSGKSTIARELEAAVREMSARRVTLFDGDEVRAMLSAGLGFDRQSRELNVQRIGYVCALVAMHGGIAIAAPIAPFAGGRSEVRTWVERAGSPFLLVHVATSLAVCEARDRKGLYALARAGKIPEFTGISSPYEPPDDADLVIDTASTTTDAAVRDIIKLLRGAGAL